MNPNYFNRNLVDSMVKSLEKVIVNESEIVGRRSAIRDQAIAANEARRATQAQIKALAQKKANEAAKAAGQGPGKYGAEHYKAAMAELKADPKFVEQLDTANRFRGWGGGNFGGSSQRSEGSAPMSGMAERGAAAMADQAERDRLQRLKGIEKIFNERGWESNGAFEPLDRAKAEAASKAESQQIRGEEQARFDREEHEKRKAKADEILKASYAKSGRSYTPSPTSPAVAADIENRAYEKSKH